MKDKQELIRQKMEGGGPKREMCMCKKQEKMLVMEMKRESQMMKKITMMRW